MHKFRDSQDILNKEQGLTQPNVQTHKGVVIQRCSHRPTKEKEILKHSHNKIGTCYVTNSIAQQ